MLELGMIGTGKCVDVQLIFGRSMAQEAVYMWIDWQNVIRFPWIG